MQSKSVLVWRFDLLIVLAFDFFVGFDDEFRSMNDNISFRNVIGILVITHIDMYGYGYVVNVSRVVYTVLLYTE